MTRTHRFAALHGAIVDIECAIPSHLDNDAAVRMAYRVGHRDARHAAAELAIKADSQAEEMLEALRTAALALAWASTRRKEVAAAYKRVSTAIEVVTRGDV